MGAGTVFLNKTAARQAQLESRLDRIQDRASSDYQRWLTPD
jgi:hypothetical protein